MNFWDNIKDTYNSVRDSAPKYQPSQNEQNFYGWMEQQGIPYTPTAERIENYAPTAGFTKIVGSGPSKMIQAWHNTIPNKQVGQLGFMEGKGFNSLRDIKVDPQYRGQGYADELMDTFKSHAGQEPRFGGTITNSPNYWEGVSNKMRTDYPTFSKGIDTALDWAKQDFGWR